MNLPTEAVLKVKGKSSTELPPHPDRGEHQQRSLNETLTAEWWKKEAAHQTREAPFFLTCPFSALYWKS